MAEAAQVDNKKDTRPTLQEQLKTVSDRMTAGESSADILDSDTIEKDNSLADTEAAVKAAAEGQEEDGAKAAAEIPDPSPDTPDDGEEEDPPAGEQDLSAPDEGEETLKPLAHWTDKQVEVWETIPEEHQSAAMSLVKVIDQSLSAKATELDTVKKRVESIDAVTAPYSAMLAAEGATAESALQAYLAGAHQLRNGSQAQKVQLLRQMATQFGIDLEAAADDLPPEPQQPELTEERINAMVEQRLQNHTKTITVGQQVDSFRSATDTDGNLLHPHFDKLSTTISAFINAGSELPDAYDKAVRADPELFEQTVNAKIAEATKTKANGEQKKVDKAKKAAGHKVNGEKPAKAVPNVKDESIVQTMQRVNKELSSEEPRL